MRKPLVFLVALLGIVSIASVVLTPISSVSAVSGKGTGNLWEASLVPCSPDICGGFYQNMATLSLEKSEITVAGNGQVKVELSKLRISATGEMAAHKTLDVFFGSFGVFQAVGTITTDSYGNFEGTIDTGEGTPFAFSSGTTVAGQFVLNDPGVRSEFITGFRVP